MKNSILLIGNSNTKSVSRFKKEAQNMNIVFDTISSKNISLSENSLNVTEDHHLTRKVLDYDVYFFRGINRNKMHKMQLIAAFLDAQGKRVVEKCFTTGSLPNDKIIHTSEKNLYHVPQSALVSDKTMDNIINEITFPVVAKELDSRMGRGVRKIESPDELKEFMQQKNKHQIMLQNYFEIEYDTRILIVGNKILGGFRRYKKPGENFLTTAPGGKRKPADLSQAEIDAALEATMLHGIEIAGVDIFEFNGKQYILEVNTSPQFTMFEKTTSINVAKEILNYLLQ